ncbi:MAG: arginase family protein [Candidatus Thorarchaeota archaeon]|jgi:agmatinase|nr:arginase family protein [Candidatus Thorarchaeota archaeon]
MPLKDSLNGYLRLPRDFFGIPQPTAGDPDVGVLGIPYDLTSSYMPGTRFGPDAIRKATDSERSHSYPLSIGQSSANNDKALSKRITLEDIGDLEVSLRLPEQAMIDITEAAAKLGEQDSHLLFMGGDHFITYPLLRGLNRSNPGTYGLVYLDAHADFYSAYSGHPYSHATTLRRILTDGLIERVNLLTHDLRAALPEQKAELVKIGAVIPKSLKSFVKAINKIAMQVNTIYISVDLDVLDPSVAPGVSHPESGGLSMVELVELLRACFATGKVKYVDIAELNPLVDTTGRTSVTARDVVKEILTGFASQKDYK